MYYYFELQYKRLFRYLESLGLYPVLTLILSPILLVALSTVIYYKTTYANLILLATVIWIFWQLSQTERNKFLKSIFSSKEYYRVRIVENILLAIPFLCILFLYQSYVYILILLALIIIFSFYSSANSSSIVVPTPFSQRPFEFIIGTRKWLLLITACYMITVISISVNNYNLGVFGLLCISLIAMTFYQYIESHFFVWIHSCSTSEFIKHKILIALRQNLILSMPCLLPLIIFYPNKLSITLLVLFIGMLGVVMSLLSKYSSYPGPLKFHDVLLMSVSIILPLFYLFSIPYFYKKVNYRLQFYLDDQH